MRRSLLLPFFLAACATGVEVCEESWPDTGKLRYRGLVEHEGGAALAQREWAFWYPDGTLQARGRFQAGTPPGPADLAADSTRVPMQGRHGAWNFWSHQGQILAEGAYDYGRREGLWTFWHENGLRAYQGRYHADRAIGAHVRWHDSGVRSELAHYHDGRITGRREMWDTAGSLVWAGQYRSGELTAVLTGKGASDHALAQTTPAHAPPEPLTASSRPD
ncbi:MAG TPA: hypothetical protein VMS76_06960 [Planctomycetota bacterium]|nr:hypothetical protein [Planctomycetota bacterium]